MYGTDQPPSTHTAAFSQFFSHTARADPSMDHSQEYSGPAWPHCQGKGRHHITAHVFQLRPYGGIEMNVLLWPPYIFAL